MSPVKSQFTYSNKLAILRQCGAAFIVCILSLNNGIALGWPSPVKKHLQSEESSLGKVSDEDFSWANSVLFLGGVLGIIFSNYNVDKFGRKVNGYVIGASQILGWLSIMLANSSTALILGRLLLGLGSGGIANAQLYISEITQDSLRGPLCALVVISMNFGALLVYILGGLFSYETLNWICFSIPTLYLITFFLLPESPLYLLMDGKKSKAVDVLAWYKGNNDTEAKERILSIQEMMKSKTTKSSFADLLTNKNAPSTVIAVLLLAGQQLSGIGIILTYAGEIFNQFSNSKSSQLPVIMIGLLQVTISSVSGSLVNVIGRKQLLLLSSLGNAIFFLLFAAYSYSEVHKFSISHALWWSPVLCGCCIVISHNLGFAFVPYILVAEMFPPDVQNAAITVSLMSAMSCAFGVAKLFPFLKFHLGADGMYLLFSVINTFFVLFVANFIKVKKEKTNILLKQIEIH